MDSEAVGRAVMAAYLATPGRSGKPRLPNEWTVLAAIVLDKQDTPGSLTVAALATGSKCLGHEIIKDSQGTVVIDSHAEVLARRCFQRFLLKELELAATAPDLAQWIERQPASHDSQARPFRLKTNVRIALFVTQAPCGDACIFEVPATSAAATSSSAADTAVTAVADAKVCESGAPYEAEPPRKVAKHQTTCSDDVHRTGAKPVAEGPGDPLQPGVHYHTVGLLRTKPGRGPRSHSMSCSDKIMRWTVIGLQGALLAPWVDPIFLHTIIVGDHYNIAAMQRSFVDRCAPVRSDLELPPTFKSPPPLLQQASANVLQNFPTRDTVLARSAASSVNEAKVIGLAEELLLVNHPLAKEVQVAAKGRRLGATAKVLAADPHSPRSWTLVCKQSLVCRWRLMRQKLAQSDLALGSTMTKTDSCRLYSELKSLDADYIRAKACFSKHFPLWLGNGAEVDRFLVPTE